ncbi:PepSY-like domain-containing protein [Catenovulum sediminis]|uniref:PepSY-like domain-containing protein n=1 Tax=Catenovulum sediminis TaxID=1740262 RepID=UPI00117F3D5E|nr:PepSY-like domain-containing protein [Catenovulum sediminis]
MRFTTIGTIVFLALAVSACGKTTEAPQIPETKQEVGSSLHQKYKLELDEIPSKVLEAIRNKRAGFTVQEAEKELKHGKTYIDVEGIDDQGNEIEFDLLQVDGQWEIVEVQRDLTLEQCPAGVITTFKKHVPEVLPKRIIESEQTNGAIIYEFYVVDKQGQEAKYEVKLENGETEFLTSEWQH